MIEKVSIIITVDKDVADQVFANIEEYLTEFYGPASQDPQTFLMRSEVVVDVK